MTGNFERVPGVSFLFFSFLFFFFFFGGGGLVLQWGMRFSTNRFVFHFCGFCICIADEALWGQAVGTNSKIRRASRGELVASKLSLSWRLVSMFNSTVER